jgi:hypothetical protein
MDGEFDHSLLGHKYRVKSSFLCSFCQQHNTIKIHITRTTLICLGTIMRHRSQTRLQVSFQKYFDKVPDNLKNYKQNN